jgi:hypothetical protein
MREDIASAVRKTATWSLAALSLIAGLLGGLFAPGCIVLVFLAVAARLDAIDPATGRANMACAIVSVVLPFIWCVGIWLVCFLRLVRRRFPVWLRACLLGVAATSTLEAATFVPALVALVRYLGTWRGAP